MGAKPNESDTGQAERSERDTARAEPDQSNTRRAEPDEGEAGLDGPAGGGEARVGGAALVFEALRILGLTRRAVPRPVVGPKAYVQWWQRVAAAAALVALVVGVGLALAAAVGLMAVAAGFLLEQAIA